MKRMAALALALALLAGCGPAPAEDGRTHILCTTYPVYLLTTALTEGAEDVAVELLVDQQTSCLHDYTLTVADMRAVDRADIIVINGAGLEEFLAGALGQKDAPVIDCSAGLPLLPSPDGDQGEADPHLWMDPRLAAGMLQNIAGGLDGLTGGGYAQRAGEIAGSLLALEAALPPQDLAPLITFHDGFQYFAQAYGLELLAAIEEEEGAEASARELKELIGLVRDHHIPAIFVEKNGSRRSADVIARETGCRVYELDLIMSGTGTGAGPYLQAMEENLAVIKEALG